MDTRDTLLLACGTSEHRKALRSLFEDSFHLLEADNSHQARLFLEQNHSCIAALLLDITAADKIDARTIRSLEKNPVLKDIPIVVFTDEKTPESTVSIFERGATDVYPVDCDPFVLRNRIHNIVELYRHKWHLQELVDEQADILRHSNDTMVDALSSIIEYRSVESGQHILRIRRFTQILLEEITRTCPEYQLTPATIRIISSAAALHDVGKISIPDSILNKPGALTAEEWEVMKSHAVTGCRILESLGDLGNRDYLRYAHNIAHYHHERWDGSGYPDGLAGDDIPICAQVVGLADAYDALTTNRVYKGAFSFEVSVNMILNGECGVFSPKLLECFKHVSRKLEKLARSYADGRSPKAEKFDVTLPQPVRQESRSSLHAVQSKYQSMLHYVNAAVIEVDLDQGVYHLVYNPDPNLVMLRPNTSFKEVQKTLAEHIIFPEDLHHFHALIYTEIPRFFQDGHHRQNHRLRLRNRVTGEPEPYEITFLRLDPSDASARRMLIVWQKAALQATRPTAAALSGQSSGTPYGLLAEVCCCRNDAHFTLESGGARLSSLVGYSTAEIGLLFRNRLIDLVVPQDRPLLRRQMDEQLSAGNTVELSYRLQHKDGHPVWVLHKGQLVLRDDGREYLYNLLMDISLAKRAQESYDLSLAQYQDILSQTGNILFECDLLSDTMTFSDTWERIFGYTPLSKNFLANIYTHSHIYPDDIPRFFEWLHALQTGSAQPAEIRIANADGRYLWCRFRGAMTRDETGKAARIMGIIVNIDADVQAAKALRQQADQDALTKLLNKQAARRQAEDYLAAFPQGARCALLIIDLDNFKQVNDLYGHLFGDAVLTQAAKELKRLFRAQDIVARIGGDEFMVLMQDTADPELVKGRCQRILTVFDETFRGQMYDCSLGCSIGVSLSPAHGATYSELFQHADQALYQAKTGGKNRCVFYDDKASAYHTLRPVATTRIDSEEQPGLADSSLVQYAFRQLYSTSNMEDAINNILSLVGRQMNVSRVYVFENSPDNRFCNNTYEWCNDGVAPEKDNLQNISYETDIPNYEANFDEHGIFYVPDVEELPQHLRDILEPQGIKSLLHCAIRDNGVFRGYIGFDECATKRLWTKEQIRTLTFFSEMLSVFLLKEQAQVELASRVDDLSSVLDNQKAWIYVIDPDTCVLRFLNDKTREVAPEATEGMFCYKALMGLDERCPGCPAENIRQAKNHERTIVNHHLNLHVQSEATLIRWGGEEACLLSCREVPPSPAAE